MFVFFFVGLLILIIVNLDDGLILSELKFIFLIGFFLVLIIFGKLIFFGVFRCRFVVSIVGRDKFNVFNFLLIL